MTRSEPHDGAALTDPSRNAASDDRPVPGDDDGTIDDNGTIDGDDTIDGDVEPEPTGLRSEGGRREIVVPLRLYKTVTVFSTLITVVLFLVGFTLVDAATLQISFVRTTVVYVLGTVGLAFAEDVLAALLATVGIACILFGTAVYVLGTRFRAQGMGKPQEDSSE
ncbi:DUF7315 family membrane protein [Halorubrum sp. DTA98]|uniref:DUF7315 family membrane protein n=1 Tax=Halorubrum sp. DTA98 TaxID=3402163 RepID=UPI003AAF233C